MGSMNTNNWLSFPDLSSSQASVSHHHQFSLGLVNEGMDNINPFQNQEWNLINAHGGHEVPKVADFLGVSKSAIDDQTDIVSYNNPISSSNNNNNDDNDSDYLFQNNGLAQVVHQSSVISGASRAYHEYQENPSNLQALTLSMGTTGNGSSSCVETTADNISASSNNSMVEATPRRTLDTFGQRTSIYRGVTRHRWTGRYEAHLWDNSCRREGQSRKGRQVYLGGYDKEEKAARSYDLAALKYWGTSTTTNFPITNYEKELEEMKHMTRQEFVASIRRKSSGFSRGASMYRGVTRHHQHGRWQARIGRVAGNKDLYLGTFSTEEEAAEAYDIAAIKFRGLNAVTNFDMNRYDVKSILESNSLPIGGGAAKRLKEAQAIESSRKRDEMMALAASPFHYGSSSSTANINTTAVSSSTTRLQGYPMMSQHAYDHSPNPSPNPSHYHNTFLSLQNSHSDNIDPSFHQNYIQTQLQLQQQFGGYNHSYGSHVTGGSFLQGIMDNSSYGSGYGLGILGASNSSSGGGGGSEHQELAVVKVDYDVPTDTGYWAGSGSGSFSMWNMADHQ